MTRPREVPEGIVRTRLLPIAEVFLVAALWASSFVAVRVVVAHAGPLTVAALRYSMAAALLLPWVRWRSIRAAPSKRWIWWRLTTIGVSQYTVGNAALFFALTMVTPAAASLSLALTPVAVWILEAVYLKERPTRQQMFGSIVAVVACVLFFVEGATGIRARAAGLLALAMISFTVLPILGRQIARQRAVDTVTLTSLPLAIGGGILLVLAGSIEGIPAMPLSAWAIIVGLAVANTLAGYLLFNHALRHLRASEANIILNLIPLGTALISWGALGDRLTPLQVAALGVAVSGITFAQRRGRVSDETVKAS